MRGKAKSVIAMVIVAGIALVGCAGTNDVAFAKKAMTLLVKGNFAAASMIDWSSIKIMGYDLAAKHAQYDKDKDRQEFEKGFIAAFGAGFRRAGAQPSAFRNWRLVKSEDQNTSIVVADSVRENTMFIFSVSHGRGASRKLTEIQIKEKDKIVTGAVMEQGYVPLVPKR
ncbi:MAG: hypothetical protein V1863_01285 [Candidatus Omnitrophota bacterium]